MTKLLGVALIGVFAGALLGEALRRNKPELFENIGQKVKAGGQKVKAGMDSVIASFQKGYQETAPAKAK
jgi:hypothetical protein